MLLRFIPTLVVLSLSENIISAMTFYTQSAVDHRLVFVAHRLQLNELEILED
jgi:hypothetical protein